MKIILPKGLKERKMKLKFLGTAAFEGIPAMFCSCQACKTAREKGGKDIRTRTQALVNDDLLIDFPNDAFVHFQTYGLDFEKIKHLLITHSHSDHLVHFDLNIRAGGFAHPKDESPLHIYVGESGYKKIEEGCQAALKQGRLELHLLKAWESFECAGYTVTPIPAEHDYASSPFVFAIERDGKTLFYVNDTGVLPEEVYEKIKEKNFKFDYLAVDCTMELGEGRWWGHFRFDEVVDFVNKLKENGNVHDNSQVCINHFSHNSYHGHDFLIQHAKKYGFDVSYDGKEVEF